MRNIVFLIFMQRACIDIRKPFTYARSSKEDISVLITSYLSFCHSFAEIRHGGRDGPAWNAG